MTRYTKEAYFQNISPSHRINMFYCCLFLSCNTLVRASIQRINHVTEAGKAVVGTFSSVLVAGALTLCALHPPVHGLKVGLMNL